MITDTARLTPTATDAPCPYCETPVKVNYAEERLHVRCPSCPGPYNHTRTGTSEKAIPDGTIAVFRLPPAGVAARSPEAVLQTAFEWDYFQIQSIRTGLYPRCSGHTTLGVRQCKNHDAEAGICPQCHSRFAVLCTYRCEHCEHFRLTAPVTHVKTRPPVAVFYYRTASTSPPSCGRTHGTFSPTTRTFS